MEESTYISLMEQLDSYLQTVSHLEVTSSSETPCSVELITPDLNVSGLTQEKLSLVHTMLHLFNTNKNGRGLKQKDIEKLHKEVVSNLSGHKNYDKLDETV